jgi:tetratricopeptide (TPR) repeat protein
LLLRRPRETSASIVEGLLRLRIAALRQIDRGADAADSVERLIKLRRGEPAELAELLRWLVAQKDWPATRLVENRCKAAIAESSDLLYLVAEAQLLRGEAATAERSARRALQLNPDRDEPSLEMHLQAGATLERRGRFAWATKEMEHAFHDSPPYSQVGVRSARLLAELCHHCEDDRRAAETLACIEKAYTQRSNQAQLLDIDPVSSGPEVRGPLTLGALRARMDYFQALHWKARGDRAKQRDCLDRALAAQSYGIDVLIECYRIPDSPAGYRTKIRELIEKRLCELREEIADIGCNHAAVAQACNEFARLAANTEGDLDEALRFSKRSIEAASVRGAYCDTLAQVYFAKGDYANAVKHQGLMAELFPNNRAAQKQLALFQKKASEKGIAIKGEKSEKVKKVPKVPPGAKSTDEQGTGLSDKAREIEKDLGYR